MSNMKILFVEDNQKDIDVFQSTLKRYQIEKNIKIDFVVAKTIKQAYQKIDKTFDGAIIDLKLDHENFAGNEVVKKIHELCRIPIAIMTGTPANAEDSFNYVGIYKKGEVQYDEILDIFFEVRQTGLVDIMGGQGLIEEVMNTVFWENVIPKLESWRRYIQNGKDTKKALLRFTINHLVELLDDDSEACIPEEMYIYPTGDTVIKTGSLIKNRNGVFFIVLTPSCDLLVRPDGNYKTDVILICEIIESKSLYKEVVDGISSSSKQKKQIKNLIKNNYTGYYHWLPKVDDFQGGFINFRKVTTISKSELKESYFSNNLFVSKSFIRDIISRFSSFYARQGQPDFDFEDLSENLLDNLS